MFASKRKLYFVFADEQDVFFTDSMLRINTMDYLWLTLRKSGFSNVFFIGETQSGLTLEIPDTDAAKKYSQWKKLFWKQEHGVPAVIQTDAPKLSRWLMRTGSNEESGSTAWVFRCTAFQKCFGSSGATLFEFLEWQNRCNNTVILLFPMCLSEREMKLFTSPDSVFAWKDYHGICLSKPVYNLIHKAEPTPIFDRLETELGSSLIQLSVFSYGKICTMLRWAALRREQDMTAEQFLDYANFLYWYVYSPNLRAYTKEPLARFANYRELSECLLQHGTFDIIDERLAVLKRLMPGARLADILYWFTPLRKDEDRTWLQITHDNQQLLQLARMPFPADFTQIGTSQDASVYDFQRWVEMQRWVMKPHFHTPVEERMEHIRSFMEVCKKCQHTGDITTALRAARALYDVALDLYMPVGSRDRLDAYRVYLQMSQASYQLHGRLMTQIRHIPESQRLDFTRRNPVISAGFNILHSYRQMLDRMGNAFLLPDFRFGALQRDALALMKQLPVDGIEMEQEPQSLTPEEQEKLFAQFENI